LCLQLEGSRHLRDRVSVVGQDILTVSSGEHSQNLLKRIEREATHRSDSLSTTSRQTLVYSHFPFYTHDYLT
jgi:hypothetical protein